MSATYRLTGRIETGELAELYEAVQAPSGEVVVKLFHPKTSDPAYALDLAETTRLLQPVRHPGILHVVDMGVVRQRLAVVREDLDGYLLGTALQRLHTKEVLLPPAVALYIIIQLLDAVQHAHDAGVIHGALTPGNVVLGRSGQPAVCDFGAMRALVAVPQLRKTFAGRGRGTYRAPEVSRGEPTSEQSDVYSLGAIAYELLTQREPVVPGSGGVSTRRSESLPPPSRLDRRINARLDPLVLRALDPSAGRRFRSCAEFASALRNFLSASGGMPTADDVRRFVGELFPNEVSVASLAAPVFKEPFTLEPISGAEMVDLGAEEPEASIVQRAPYSRALTEEEASAETQEAAGPAFAEYRPEDYEPDIAPSQTRTRAPQPTPPPENEGTQMGTSGLEQGWDAPPGAAPPKPRRQMGQSSGAAGQGSAKPAGRNPRLRVVEDFSSPEPLPDDDEEFSVVGRRAAARAAKRAAAPVDRSRTLPDPMPAVIPAASRPRDDIAMPPPSAPSLPATPPRMPTMEREVQRIQGRRGRMVAIAGAIALVGLLSFAIAAWRLGGPEEGVAELEDEPLPDVLPVPPPPPLPIARPATPAPARGGAAHEESAPADEDSSPAPSYRPPPKSQRGYLTVEANVPARVYVDGELVARSTPVTRLPVRPGVRLIMLVAISTGEREQLELRIEKGKLRQVNVPGFRRK
ncbi:serine/threonine protein kinase [Myxococcus sp. K15C18031901]|uniref:serine/threonine-protein kinase n=1 Tax=Myxococcus dinghuensis TaxID=2906761 RepID=UPI0020A8318C|nr:serine/threonine-protein kinase [Myxococcus dinghuensis]MCP3099392.1 serine/threonine protein kinase [Myxococcus dinghuensis]